MNQLGSESDDKATETAITPTPHTDDRRGGNQQGGRPGAWCDDHLFKDDSERLKATVLHGESEDGQAREVIRASRVKNVE